MYAIQRTMTYAGGKIVKMFFKETSGFGIELTSSLADAHKFQEREEAEKCISCISSPAGVGQFKILDFSL